MAWLMVGDAKQKARADVRRAQTKFERSQRKREAIRQARRESFESARSAGLSLAEIADSANERERELLQARAEGRQP
jgi:hypothetical protein